MFLLLNFWNAEIICQTTHRAKLPEIGHTAEFSKLEGSPMLGLIASLVLKMGLNP
jgi:hypothetical protein